MLLLAEQVLNGLQLGVMLFLVAAGLTLIFGVMGVINLAHGSLYMIGAFACAYTAQVTGSFWLGLLAAGLAAALVGLLIEILVVRRLYARDHLDQVLATFGLILFFNELVKIVFGPRPLYLDIPAVLSGAVTILPGMPYSAYRLLIIAIGVSLAVVLWLIIQRTRTGMLIRAGETDGEMVRALGVDIGRLFSVVFALGAVFAGVAGALVGALRAVQVGMGEAILVTAFVVVVIGGIGSVRGALIAALLVGLVDTLSRAFLPMLLGLLTDPSTAATVGSSIGSMAIYLVMAIVLIWRPQGLFPAAAG